MVVHLTLLADQGRTCRCQRSGVGKQLDEPFERAGRPALVGLRRLYCCVDLCHLGTCLGRRGVVEGGARQCAAEVAYLAREPWAVGIMTFGNLDGMLPDHPYFDPLYRAAQDTDLPICFHGGTDRPPFAPGRDDVGNNMFMMHLTGHVWHQMRVMAAVVGGGLFERYPTLRIGFFEGGISWVPWWAERMDGHYKHFARHTPHLTRPPSEHMRGERCFYTFDPDEALLPEAMRLIGVSRLMWASDYPHFDAEFPDAAELVVNNQRLTADEKRAILADNALRFFRRIQP